MVPFQLIIATALAWSGEPDTVILDFTAVWCGPCQQVSPLVSKMERDGVSIQRVDVDQKPELARKYGIKTIPAFVLLVDGKEISRSDFKNSSPTAELQRLAAMLPKQASEPQTKQVSETKSSPRQASRANNGSSSLGDEAPLPRKDPPQPPAESPGIIDRLLRKKKEPAPVAPREVRAQGEDAPAAAEPAPATPLGATVRLRVKDPQGENLGTGTIIDSQPGRTLILTCGHIFRQWGKGSRIQVELFRGSRSTTFAGTKVAFDLDDDMGLVSISTEQPLPASRVAAAGTKILAGAPVVSVGCSGGNDPSMEAQRIITLNRYSGPDNIECSVVPAEGRSGGGLFDRGGQVIGVCMCADPHHREGLYAGLKTIHAFLDRQQLSHLYGGESRGEERTQIAALPSIAMELTEEAPAESAELPARRSLYEKIAEPDESTAGLRRQSPALSRDDVVGSEVVIIIHSNGKAGTPSRVVRLHRASQGFYEHLLPELETDDMLHETTLKTTTSASAKPVGRQVRKPEMPAAQASQGDANPAKTASSPEPYRRRRPSAD